MDESIKEFLEERRIGWLKKKLKTNMTDEEKIKLEQESQEKYNFAIWLPDAAKRAGQLSLVSHPSKFSHPSSKTSMVIAEAKQNLDGFLRSGQVEIKLDVVGNAAALDVDKFLNLKLMDDQTILNHLETNTSYIQDIFSLSKTAFTELSEGFLSVKKENNKSVTHGKLKQVYFPVGDDYHLLSLLTPSGLLFELKQRILKMRFSEETKQARDDKKHQRHNEQGFDELFNLSVIGFGGTKPQNISVLNNQNGGKAYLLPSVPPKIDKHKTRLPKKNFFSEILWAKRYRDSFLAFHRLLSAGINNLNIRQGRDRCILSILDQVLHQVWQIRKENPGWSEKDTYKMLPLYQKIWLDDHYRDQRESESEWIDKIIENFSRWFIHGYQKIIPEAHPLSDDELLHVKQLLRNHEEGLK